MSDLALQFDPKTIALLVGLALAAGFGLLFGSDKNGASSDGFWGDNSWGDGCDGGDGSD